MNTEELKKYLSNKYQGNRSFLENVIFPIFGNERFIDGYEDEILETNPEYQTMANATGIRSVKDVGVIYIDGEPLQIFDISVSDRIMMERNRVTIQSLVRRMMDQYSNAFMIFHYEDVSRWDWRFTFCHKSANKEESTDSKRYTFLLGPKQSCRTAADNFVKLYNNRANLTLKNIEDAFSVEALSERFFNEYKGIYADIIFYITGKHMVKKGSKWEEVKEGRACRKILDEFCEFDDPEKAVRDYVKKLMGRLVFLQFLQKKGWLGVPVDKQWGDGDNEFTQHLFEKCDDRNNFVDDVLEKLFNDLNTERKDDVSKIKGLGYKFKVPYLNGGLFECDAADKANFPLPARYMEEMLEFFSRYNFTIDENDPNDAEVGVDPEMLGRIFENLLEDNKDKGAFYTPKEIVTYMCRESLIAYLQTGIEDEATKEALRQFVTTHDAEHLGTNKEFRQQVDDALKTVKICDPAIGSGAFPMGLLKELFLCRTALEGIEQNKAAEIKKHIIQQNIYGVDIEKGAVDIARLRFWLSLIVDEETPQALPNLDFKIMQGNSLLEQYKGVDLSTVVEKKKDGMVDMFDDIVDVLRLDLRKLLAKYYEFTDHKEKKKLRKEITDNVKQQLLEQGVTVNFGDIDLAENDQFMLWHTWFYDVFSQGGFDIVIGNPPYLSYYSRQAVSVDEVLLECLKNTAKFVKNKKAKGRYHSVQFFLDKGLSLSNSQGICSYIIDFSFFEKPFKDIRDYILNYFHVKEIVSDLKAFDNVASGQIILTLDHDLSDKTIWKTDIAGNNVIVSNKIWREDPQKEFSLPKNENLLTKIENKSICLSELGDVRTGVNIGGVKGYFLSTNPSHYPFVSGGDNVQPYYVNYPTKLQIKRGETYFDFNKNIEKQIWDNRIGTPSIGESNSRFIRPKIIIRQSDTRITAALDVDNHFHCGYSLFTFNVHGDDIMFLKYILGILNSTLITFYMKEKKWIKIAPGKNPQIRVDDVKKTPVCQMKEKVKNSIVKKVDMILSSKNKNPSADTSALEHEIDHLVYQHYGLTEDEIKIIEG